VPQRANEALEPALVGQAGMGVEELQMPRRLRPPTVASRAMPAAGETARRCVRCRSSRMICEGLGVKFPGPAGAEGSVASTDRPLLIQLRAS
jgi:hypothetical protein